MVADPLGGVDTTDTVRTEAAVDRGSSVVQTCSYVMRVRWIPGHRPGGCAFTRLPRTDATPSLRPVSQSVGVEIWRGRRVGSVDQDVRPSSSVARCRQICRKVPAHRFTTTPVRLRANHRLLAWEALRSDPWNVSCTGKRSTGSGQEAKIRPTGAIHLGEVERPVQRVLCGVASHRRQNPERQVEAD